jgi:transposase InsO family protein
MEYVLNTLDKLNRVTTDTTTRTGRHAILEATEGIGGNPTQAADHSQPKPEHPQPATSPTPRGLENKWFANFVDEYRGRNPVFHMKMGRSGNNTLRTLLDTGAACNLIGEETLKNTGIIHTIHPTNRKASDVRGRPVELTGITTLECHIGGTRFDIEFEIIKGGDVLILGNEFVYNNDLVIIARSGFGTRNFLPATPTRAAATQEFDVIACWDTLIEQGDCSLIRVKTRTPKRQWAVHINRVFLIDGEPVEGLEIIPSLSAMNMEGELTVLISNEDGTQDITIPKGCILARASTQFQDGETIVAAIMAEMAEIQDVQINRVESTHILGNTDPTRCIDGDIQPPGFEYDGPKTGSKYDPERENDRQVTVENTVIHLEPKHLKDRVRKSLQKHKGLFSTHNYDIGHYSINGRVQKVKLKVSDTTPIVEKYRSLSPAKREAAGQIMDQLEKARIISRKAGAWASQAVWVTKALPELTPQRAAELGIEYMPGAKDPTGKRNLRFCQDFRALNNRLESIEWPIPSIKQVLSRLRETQYVTVMDASHSFYSIELEDESKLYTGFQTCERAYVMNRLAMGLKASSGILNACLARTLQGSESFVLPYSDNILILSPDAESHTQHIERVLQQLQDHNWKFKLAKCHWGVSDKIKIFGMQVDLKNKSISPDPTKIEEILATPLPHRKKALRGFLGSIGFITECLPDIGADLATLQELIKGQDDKIQWNTETKAAFQNTLNVIAGGPKIAMPDWKKPMHVVCDAGPQHTGTMLAQIDEDGKWQPLGFYNKKLSPAEQKLSQIEREALAVVYGLRQTAYYTAHTKVFIHCDNRPFVMLHKYASQNMKLARWKMWIDTFDHELVWEKSSSPQMKFVDFLSRPPIQKLKNRRITEEDIERVKLTQQPPDGIYNKEQYSKVIAHITQQETQTEDHPVGRAILETVPHNKGKLWTRDQQEVTSRIAVLTRRQQLALGQPSRKTATPEPTSSPEEATIELILNDCPFLNLEKLRTLQKECSTLGRIYKNIAQYPTYTIKDGILLKTFVFKDIRRILLAVPVALADDLISDLHRGVGATHHGTKKLMQLIRTRYFIPQLKRRVEKTTSNCGVCNFYKPRHTGGRRPDAKSMKARGPGDIWAMDHIKIVTKDDHGGRSSLLCFVDMYSHFAVCRAVETTITARQAADIFLTDIIGRFGVPRAVLSDNGPDMDNTLWREMANLLSIRKLTISPGSPRSNGICEKVQGLILAGIRLQAAQYRVKPERFADLAVWACLAHNATPYNDITPPLSPAEIFLGRSIAESSFFGFANAAYSYRNLEQFNQHMVAAQQTIAEILEAKSRYEQELQIKKGCLEAKHWDYPPGTIVALKDKTLSRTETNKKLRPRYRGTFIVVSQTPTSCLIRPFSSESILEDMETQEEATRGRGKALPRYKIIKCDKDDLKKTKQLIFYSTPMARKFAEHLRSPAPDLDREYDLDETEEGRSEEEEIEPEEQEETPEGAAQQETKRKRHPEREPDQPSTKLARLQGDQKQSFPFSYD